MRETSEIDKIVVVSNTGPLISAFQCGRTDLLKRYFSMIYITSSELSELAVHGWTDEIRSLIREGFVEVFSELTDKELEQAKRVAKRIAAISTSEDFHEHFPEAEAIVIAQRPDLTVDQILLDEKAARTVAKNLGLRITGFPGVIGRAGLDGLLKQDEIRQLLKKCQQHGTHYSNELIETVARTYGR